jgi:hypothetical protein
MHRATNAPHISVYQKQNKRVIEGKVGANISREKPRFCTIYFPLTVPSTFGLILEIAIFPENSRANCISLRAPLREKLNSIATCQEEQIL